MAGNLGQIIIVGGGIIGCSIAYHLTELGVPCTLVERRSIACAASGHAGGFLARTWCDGGPSGPLARASFDLHKTYGAMFDCDYRAVHTLEVVVDEKGSRKRRLSSAPDWLDKDNVVHTNLVGNTTNTAQVHPKKLTQCFIKAAQEKGCRVIIDQVTGVEFSAEDKTVIKSVNLSENGSMACDILVLAMGPWTNVASQWFDYQLPHIGTERAHSVVMTPSKPISAHVLFLECKKEEGAKHPEIYPRPDGTVYICGYNDNVSLPEHADLIKPNVESLEALQLLGKNISSALEDSILEIGHACYLPLPATNAPAIGKIPKYNGKLYIAAGHYCWGILNAPATGKGLAELIVNGHSSIDLSPFDPANFI